MGDGYATQYEAVLAAIEELKYDGGGRVWICREDCASAREEECDCNPSSIEVPSNQ